MKIAVLNEVNESERRVALIPDSVARLTKSGFSVIIQSGAGGGAYFSDNDYISAGAQVVNDIKVLYDEANVILRVTPPLRENDGVSEIELLRDAQVIVGFLNPYRHPEIIEKIAKKGVTAFSMDLIPRISRAQSMDALSSQASVSGYKAVLLAASALGKFLPFLTTAAGTLRPAKVLVVGAGVAGLQAIATARRLGAEVEAFDIRPAVKEEVQSLGAKFIDLEIQEETEGSGGYAREVSEEARKHEQQILADHVAISDIVITTALVPGKRAPVLITEEVVRRMKPGSVIVDLAAEQGGNCELTSPGEETVKFGILIIGKKNLPATVPVHASQMYAKNLISFLELITKDGELNLNFDDEIVAESCVTHAGEVRNPRIREIVTTG